MTIAEKEGFSGEPREVSAGHQAAPDAFGYALDIITPNGTGPSGQGPAFGAFLGSSHGVA